MAEQTAYEVVYPVLRGRIHRRGSVVELDEHDGAKLTAAGNVRPIVVKTEIVETGAIVDLETLNKTQLAQYALSTLSIQLPSSLTKAEMIEQIKTAVAS